MSELPVLITNHNKKNGGKTSIFFSIAITRFPELSALRRVRDSNPRNRQMLAIVSHPALYSGLINQFLRIFEPALPDFYPFFFTWKNYAKVQKILDICKFLGNFFSNKNDI